MTTENQLTFKLNTSAEPSRSVYIQDEKKCDSLQDFVDYLVDFGNVSSLLVDVIPHMTDDKHLRLEVLNQFNEIEDDMTKLMRLLDIIVVDDSLYGHFLYEMTRCYIFPGPRFFHDYYERKNLEKFIQQP